MITKKEKKKERSKIKVDIQEFQKIILKIKENFYASKKVIEEAIKQQNDYVFSFEDCINEIDRAKQNIIENKSKIEINQNVAIVYNGNIEATINIIINSIYFNNKVDFFGEGCDIVRTVLLELINITLENEFKISNKFKIFQDINVLIKKQEEYNKIIYIGDYFEYKNITEFINKNVIYNSYGFLKVYINKLKYEKEHKELVKKAYIKNFYIEYYDDINDFIENVNQEDTVVICEDIEEISKKIKTKNILTNKEFLNNYNFTYTI